MGSARASFAPCAAHICSEKHLGFFQKFRAVLGRKCLRLLKKRGHNSYLGAYSDIGATERKRLLQQSVTDDVISIHPDGETIVSSLSRPFGAFPMRELEEKPVCPLETTEM
jgi:hypothetical protein